MEYLSNFLGFELFPIRNGANLPQWAMAPAVGFGGPFGVIGGDLGRLFYHLPQNRTMLRPVILFTPAAMR